MKERREVAVEDHFEDLHHRRDDADVADQAEEAEINLRQARPCERALLEHVVIEERVERDRDHLDDYDCEPETKGGLDAFGNREERAHAEEKR